MSPDARPALPCGTYVARQMDSGLQVGCERFRVERSTQGLRFLSEAIPFGPPSPRQRATFHLDEDWTPRRLEVESGDGSALHVEFHDERADLKARGGGLWREMSVPVPRHEALVLLAGSLWAPLHAVRRMGPDAAKTARFRLVPEGGCQLRPDAGTTPGGAGTKLRMDLWAFGAEDRLHLLLDGAGNVLRFRSRNRNLLVELEPDPC